MYVVLELDGSGNQTAFDVYGGSSIITRSTGAGVRYYAYNGHGDVVQLTNGAGNVITENRYGAFGNMTTNVPNDTNPLRYCGEYYDRESSKNSKGRLPHNGGLSLRGEYWRENAGVIIDPIFFFQRWEAKAMPRLF